MRFLVFDFELCACPTACAVLRCRMLLLDLGGTEVGYEGYKGRIWGYAGGGSRAFRHGTKT
eukprot:100241-Rhodomonas_salina.1